jgi:fructoselysine-6-P-deglycase FrlB-like protein
VTTNTNPSDEVVTALEVGSQPDVWRQALALPEDEVGVLPHAGERVLALGCGTSYYILDAYAHRRQELQGSVTRAAIASEYDELEDYDRILFLSRSGTTGELMTLLNRFGTRAPTVSLCGTARSPVALATAQSLVVPFADERSVVQTRFATTALVLLRRSIGDDLSHLAAFAEAALAAELPITPGEGVEHVVFLGTGWTVGLANEAALKCREAALLFSEAYAVGEYRHGPIALASEATLVWTFSPLPADVRAAILATGAQLTEAPDDPLADLPRVHRLALAFAEARGIDPDTPRYLSRSVVNP